MKVVVQVVDYASVRVHDEIVGKINQGYLLYIGIDSNDTKEIVHKMASKIVNMRINKDENGKTNLSILDIHGAILSISQFTLCADVKKRRPSFSHGASPEVAKNLYEEFNQELLSYHINVQTGIFKEEMLVESQNHGPFTIFLTENDL